MFAFKGEVNYTRWESQHVVVVDIREETFELLAQWIEQLVDHCEQYFHECACPIKEDNECCGNCEPGECELEQEDPMEDEQRLQSILTIIELCLRHTDEEGRRNIFKCILEQADEWKS